MHKPVKLQSQSMNGFIKALAHLLASGYSIWGWPEAVLHLHTSSFLFLTSQEHLISNG